ncbi:hypothetical protein [Gordonia hongkongensis]|uniref:hypothetical protein n=1 Tax=Gordonia hongkongensis TaxID=1701090 RepID=UPI003EC056D7
MMSAALAGVTVIRFVTFVAVLSPSEYGTLNIYATLVNVLPLAMSWGLTLQYQRIARSSDGSVTNTLLKYALLVNAASAIPTLVVIYLVGQRLGGVGSLLICVVSAFLICIATSLSTCYSQIAVGYGYRTRGSLMLFCVNVTSAVPVPIVLLSGQGSVDAILASWAAAAMVGLLCSRLMLPRYPLLPPGDVSGTLSFFEGFATLPAQLGPWLIFFLVRFLIGVNLGASEVAVFAIASTVPDMAYLVCVALLGYFANRLLTNEVKVYRALVYVLPLYVLLVVLGGLGVYLILPYLGDDQYAFSLSVFLILSSLGAVRIYITAWRARAIGARRLHQTAWVYLVATGGLGGVMVLLPDLSLIMYALLTLAGFCIIAFVQRVGIVTGPRGGDHQRGETR